MASLKISGIILLVVGFVLIIVGLLVGFLIPAAVYSGIEDALVVDKAEPDSESYQHWLNSNYTDAAPAYKKYTFYNLTNQAAVQSTGAKPIYAPVGPYVYRYYLEKNEVSFPDNGNQVSYKLKTDYYFVPELSAPGLDPMTDKVTLTNIPYFSIINQAGSESNLFYSMAGGALAKMLYLGMLPNYRFPAIASLLPPYIDNMQQDLIQEIASNQSISAPEATGVFYSIWANDTTDPIYDGFTSLMRLSVNNVSTGLLPTQVAGLLSPSSSIALTNPAAYTTWFGASAGDPTAIAGIKSALGLTDAQFNAIMGWRVRFSNYAVPYMLAAKGLSSLDDMAIYQWATGNFSNVSPVLYLGQNLHIEFPFTTGYSGQPMSLASAKLLLTGSKNITDPTNIGTFLYLNATNSPALQAIYGLTPSQIVAVSNYIDLFLGQIVGSLVAPANIFRTEIVNNWLWNTTDPLVYTVLGQHVQTNFFSNDTIDKLPNTFKTGKDDIKNIKQFVAWRNQTTLTNIWRTPQPVQGTDGTNFAPFLKESQGLTVWVENLLRPVLFTFRKTLTLHGITLNRYSLDDTVLAPDDNYYQTISGMGNMTSDIADYNGNPVFVSKPNLLDAPEEYLNKVEGLVPDRENNDIFLDVDPLTGSGMRVFNRLQVNAYVNAAWSAKFNRFNKAIPTDTMYPLVAVEVTSEITEKQANSYKSSVYGPLIAATIVLGVGVAVGGLLVIIGIVLLIVFFVRRRNGSEAIEMH